MLTLNVVPSLSLQSFVRPTFDTTDEFLLGVTVTYPVVSHGKSGKSGKSISPPLRLRELASLSPRFSVAQRSCDMDDGPVTLRPGETATMFYEVRVVEGGGENSTMQLCRDLIPSSSSSSATSTSSSTSTDTWTLRELDELTKNQEGGDANNVSSAPLSNLSNLSDLSKMLCLDHVSAMTEAIRSHRRNVKKIENELIGPAVGQVSIEEVRRRNQKLVQMKREAGMPEEEEMIPSPWGTTALGWKATGTIHLVGLWETVRDDDDDDGEEEEKKNSSFSSATGMTTQLRVPIRPDTPNPKDPTRTCPLMLSCIYPEVVTNVRFDSTTPCRTVPVIVRVTNGAPLSESPLSFTLEVMPDKERRFMWSGRTRVQVELKPSASEEICLDAHFFGPGTYDLNTFRFHIDVRKNKRTREEIVVFKYPSLNYLVRVEEEEKEEEEKEKA